MMLTSKDRPSDEAVAELAEKLYSILISEKNTEPIKSVEINYFGGTNLFSGTNISEGTCNRSDLEAVK